MKWKEFWHEVVRAAQGREAWMLEDLEERYGRALERVSGLQTALDIEQANHQATAEDLQTLHRNVTKILAGLSHEGKCSPYHLGQLDWALEDARPALELSSRRSPRTTTTHSTDPGGS
jgi:hypothetical protein